MARSARIVIVQSPYQNAFFAELAKVIADEITQLNRRVVVVSEPHTFAPQIDDVYILLPPHEWMAIEGDAWLQDDLLAARTIGVGAEQPHSTFFATNAAVGGRLGALFDFSAHAVEAFVSAGIDAKHLPFGYTRSWDRYRPAPNGPGPDVIFLGNFKPRRLHQLAAMAGQLGRFQTHLVIADNTAPNVDSSRWFVAGDRKRDLLAASTVMLNIHQSDEAYFEWLRFTEAALCGVVFLTERCEKSEPYLPGHDFVEVPLETMGDELDGLLHDPTRLSKIRAQAYDSVRRRPLAVGVGSLVAVADELLLTRSPTSLPSRRRSAPLPHAKPHADDQSGRLARFARSSTLRPTWPRRGATTEPVEPEAPSEVVELIVVGTGDVDNAPEGVAVYFASDVRAGCDRALKSRHTFVGVVPAGLRFTDLGYERVAATARLSGAAIGMTVVASVGGPPVLSALWPPSAGERSSSGFWLAAPKLIESIDPTTLGVRLVHGQAWGHVPAPVAEFRGLRIEAQSVRRKHR